MTFLIESSAYLLYVRTYLCASIDCYCHRMKWALYKKNGVRISLLLSLLFEIVMNSLFNLMIKTAVFHCIFLNFEVLKSVPVFLTVGTARGQGIIRVVVFATFF